MSPKYNSFNKQTACSIPLGAKHECDQIRLLTLRPLQKSIKCDDKRFQAKLSKKERKDYITNEWDEKTDEKPCKEHMMWCDDDGWMSNTIWSRLTAYFPSYSSRLIFSYPLTSFFAFFDFAVSTNFSAIYTELLIYFSFIVVTMMNCWPRRFGWPYLDWQSMERNWLSQQLVPHDWVTAGWTNGRAADGHLPSSVSLLDSTQWTYSRSYEKFLINLMSRIRQRFTESYLGASLRVCSV